ncbi:MAG: fused MFS/spermidine synthase [Rhodospirillales bacterium]|nr:fused MFS/spermidine synthase [Rhodospirillales bacterium]
MFRQFGYAVVLFVSSACGLVVEIVAGRLLAPYVGMSLYTWTAVIAVVLAGFSIGHWIGGRLAGSGVNAQVGERRVAMALGLSALTTLASLAALRQVYVLFSDVGLGTIPLIVVLCAGAFLLPSLAVGVVSPILTKLAVDLNPLMAGRAIGRMYALGALGSIAGTLAAGYVFISWIGSTGTMIAVAVTYAVLALALALADPLRALLVVVLVVGGGGIGWWGANAGAFEKPCTVESDYYCIRIDDFRPYSGRESRLMALDHLAHSMNDRDDPTLLYSPYIHFVDEVARHHFGGAIPNSSFFIGGGGFSLPRAWASERSGVEIIVAEIDPEVTRAAQDYLWFSSAAPGMTVVDLDARVALKNFPEGPRFDVVFGDAFHDISIPQHLVSREFHREIHSRLKPGGFYILNVVDRGVEPRFLFSLVQTLRRDFGVVEVWVEAGEADIDGRVTFVVLAASRPTRVDILRSARGVEREWVRWPAPDLVDRIALADVPVLTDDFAPVDRLMSPLLLDGK